jgi:hypothetical protein
MSSALSSEPSFLPSLGSKTRSVQKLPPPSRAQQKRGASVSIVSGDDDGAVWSAAAKLGMFSAHSERSHARLHGGAGGRP